MTEEQIGTQSYEEVEQYLLNFGLLHFESNITADLNNFIPWLLETSYVNNTYDESGGIQCEPHRNIFRRLISYC